MKKRYSKYINLLFLLADILTILVIVYSIHEPEYFNRYFISYAILFWLIAAFSTKFYKVFRFTSTFKVIRLLVTQFSLFALGYFSYFTIFREGVVINSQMKVLILLFTVVSSVKLIGFFLLRKYRTFGNNYRKVVVLGQDSSVKKMITMFQEDKELGYQYEGYFSDEKKKSKFYLGKIADVPAYVLEKNIDEVYCSQKEIFPEQLKKITRFATKNNRIVKIIPNANELFNKNVKNEYYGDSTLVLKVKQLPFEVLENRVIKRVFDIVFSLFICIFVLSWLYPIIFVLVKIESRGPVIFKQVREGLNGTSFVCYKFRSMYVNSDQNTMHASVHDSRVTKVGAFMRKTSIDEFPQFLNVLVGAMSVVGPRPHIEKFAVEYQKDVDNYIQRHDVKPGITGLAQVSGYRGEIQKRSDIKNRVRLDIFYIENWSLSLDLKIIFKTIFSVFRGDEKAY